MVVILYTIGVSAFRGADPGTGFFQKNHSVWEEILAAIHGSTLGNIPDAATSTHLLLSLSTSNCLHCQPDKSRAAGGTGCRPGSGGCSASRWHGSLSIQGRDHTCCIGSRPCPLTVFRLVRDGASAHASTLFVARGNHTLLEALLGIDINLNDTAG